MPRAVVCGTIAEPDYIDPAALGVAERMLEEIECPRRSRFTPSQLAEVMGDEPRTWQRRCELGEIGAFRKGRDWVIPWARLVAWVALRQNVIAMN